MLVNRTLIDGHSPSPEDLDWLLASRALAFGEGMFTSVRVWQGRLLFWPDHLKRLSGGLAGLKVELPARFWKQLEEEAQAQAEVLQEGMLKVMLLAGPGGRGYRRSVSGERWHRVLHLRSLPLNESAYQGAHLWWLASPANGPQTASKHLNRLCQVLASDACPDKYPEALLYGQQGQLVEGIARNVFWYAKGHWHTPSLQTGALAGVLRKQLLNKLDVVEEDEAGLQEIQDAEELLVCNSLQGIWPVTSLSDASGLLATWPLGSKTKALMQTFHPEMGLPLA
ncbi:aminotransferase class IV [Marinospirillum sp.]|uniref:aminotransferase class IV n=1 Tax=Marinospirillum sp. TaxID=2183934 RepID=UPI00384EE3AB